MTLPKFKWLLLLQMFVWVDCLLIFRGVGKKSSFPRHCSSSGETSSQGTLRGNGNLPKDSLSKAAPEVLFRQFLSTEFGVTNGAETSYNSNNSFIVTEFFEYNERKTESEFIVKLFAKRQSDRSKIKAQYDKVKNPVIAIPAAPGSGKSTFLVNFPHSQSYRDYCSNPIVAPLTFNGAMTAMPTKPSHTFGLRILFGAAMSMQSAEWREVQPNGSADAVLIWLRFLELFEDYHSLSAYDAITILKRVYGSERRILVLVDELSKIAFYDKADAAVMREIGSILDRFGEVDVLISLLSPQYVETLLTGSQRPIRYVVLQSLIKCGLGHDECVAWANGLLRDLGKSEREVDAFAIRFLQSIDLMLSGHPRSLEFLVSQLQDDSAWPMTIKKLKAAKPGTVKSKTLFADVLASVSFDLLNSDSTVQPFVATNIVALEKSLKFAIEETDEFRHLLENGSVLVIPQSTFVNNYRSTISLLSFLRLVQTTVARVDMDPAVSAAQALFNHDLASKTASIGTLFERAVALTVVCYSLVTELFLFEKGCLFGCPDYVTKRLPSNIPKLTTRIAKKFEDMIIPAGGPRANELVVAFEDCPGFDSVVTLVATENTPAHTVYLEQKVAAVKDARSMRLSKIVNVLKFHFVSTLAFTKGKQLESFRHIHVLFYEWGSDLTDAVISKADFAMAVSCFFERLQEGSEENSNIVDVMVRECVQDSSQLSHMRECFNAYLSADEEIDADTVQACVIGREVLEQWLVPPVAAIPLLVESVIADAETPTKA